MPSYPYSDTCPICGGAWTFAMSVPVPETASGPEMAGRTRPQHRCDRAHAFWVDGSGENQTLRPV
jgi:hypothetical protein